MKNRTLKLLAVILVIAVFAGLIASCNGGTETPSNTPGESGSPSQSDSASPSQSASPSNSGGGNSDVIVGGDTDVADLLEDDGSPKSITMCTWWGGETYKTLKSVIDKFTEDNPHITVDMLLWPFGGDYEQKLVVAYSSGEAPDIIKLDAYQYFAKFWYGGVLEQLSDYLDAMNYDTSRWLPGVEELHTYDGKIVAMPLHREQIVTWYNADLFKEAGIPNLPDQPTWDDIEEAAKAVMTLGTNDWGDRIFGVRIHKTYTNCLDIYLNDMGLPITGDANSANFNTPERVAAAQRLFDLQINYGPASGLTFEPMLTGVLGIDIGQPTGFINEAGRTVNFETRIVNFPVVDASKGQIVAVSCNSVGLCTQSSVKAAAVKLMSAFTSPESEEMLKAYVLTPSSGKVYDEFKTVKDVFPFDAYSIIDPKPGARFSMAAKFDWMSRASAPFEAVANGDMTVLEYFEEGQNNIDDWLNHPDRDVLALN